MRAGPTHLVRSRSVADPKDASLELMGLADRLRDGVDDRAAGEGDAPLAEPLPRRETGGVAAGVLLLVPGVLLGTDGGRLYAVLLSGDTCAAAVRAAGARFMGSGVIARPRAEAAPAAAVGSLRITCTTLTPARAAAAAVPKRPSGCDGSCGTAGDALLLAGLLAAVWPFWAVLAGPRMAAVVCSTSRRSARSSWRRQSAEGVLPLSSAHVALTAPSPSRWLAVYLAARWRAKWSRPRSCLPPCFCWTASSPAPMRRSCAAAAAPRCFSAWRVTSSVRDVSGAALRAVSGPPPPPPVGCPATPHSRPMSTATASCCPPSSGMDAMSGVCGCVAACSSAAPPSSLAQSSASSSARLSSLSSSKPSLSTLRRRCLRLARGACGGAALRACLAAKAATAARSTFCTRACAPSTVRTPTTSPPWGSFPPPPAAAAVPAAVRRRSRQLHNPSASHAACASAAAASSSARRASASALAASRATSWATAGDRPATDSVDTWATTSSSARSLAPVSRCSLTWASSSRTRLMPRACCA